MIERKAYPPPIMQFFEYGHLKPNLQEVSKPFHTLAQLMCHLPNNSERQLAFRKLLEAKDSAVRSVIFKSTSAPANRGIKGDL